LLIGAPAQERDKHEHGGNKVAVRVRTNNGPEKGGCSE